MKHQKIGNKKQVFHVFSWFFPLYMYSSRVGFFPNPLTTTSALKRKTSIFRWNAPKVESWRGLDSAGVRWCFLRNDDFQKIGAKRFFSDPRNPVEMVPELLLNVWPLIRGFQEHIVVHLLRCMLKKGYEI